MFHVTNLLGSVFSQYWLLQTEKRLEERKKRNIRTENCRIYTLAMRGDGKISCLYPSLSTLNGVPFMLASNSWNELAQPLEIPSIRQLCNALHLLVFKMDIGKGSRECCAEKEKI